MSDEGPFKAYRNEQFLNSPDARQIRILSEYLEPKARLEEYQVSDTIVFFGSARLKARDDANQKLAAARAHGDDIADAEREIKMSRFYEDARSLAGRLTEWSKSLEDTKRRFLVCTGGGPGIMEILSFAICAITASRSKLSTGRICAPRIIAASQPAL